MPKGAKPIIVKLINSLYGEKQAAYVWYKRLRYILINIMELEPLMNEDCILIKRYQGSIVLMITIHVDDIIVTALTKKIVEDFKNEFKKHVEDIRSFSQVKKYVGIEINQHNNLLTIGQPSYTSEIVRDCHVQLNPSQGLPVKNTYEFRDDDDSKGTISILPIIGKLRYLADCTRSDLLTILSVLGARANKANTSYQGATKQVLQYIANTPNYEVVIGNRNVKKVVFLFAFCDASHNNKIDLCDRVGGSFFLGFNVGAFYSYSKKDNTISNSPMHAEIKAIDRTLQLVLVYRDLLKELDFPQKNATPIFTDSQSAVKLFQLFKSSKKVKGLRRAVNNIRYALNRRWIKLVFIGSTENCADAHTKILDNLSFSRCVKRLREGYSEEEINSFLNTREIAEGELAEFPHQFEGHVKEMN